MALAQERSAARAARDYPAADELKTRIETAGWRVVDAGTTFELRPARPADVVEDARTVYGAVDSVPSRLDEPASRMATLVVIAQGEHSPDLVLQACSVHASAETQVLVVAGQETPIEGPAHEIIWTVEPFGAGDALQAALRRAVGTVVVVIDPGRVPTRDVVGPLTEALADPAVAIAASEGLISTDLHRYQPATSGDATTVASGCYAFRREDAIARGPIDDRLRLGSSVATWLGLILRDRGPDSEPRRAAVIELPFETTGATRKQEKLRCGVLTLGSTTSRQPS